MHEDDQHADSRVELEATRPEPEALAPDVSNEVRYYDARRQSPAATTFSGDTDNPAVAVLEHIYRDMIAALQQMYRDTIAAKDDALAGRDRELETKDALIEHLKRRAEEAEARASQALRYIGELDQTAAHAASRESPSETAARSGKRRGIGRFFKR